MFKLSQIVYQYLTLHCSNILVFLSFAKANYVCTLKPPNFLIYHLILETADDNTTHRQNVILNSEVLITVSLIYDM